MDIVTRLSNRYASDLAVQFGYMKRKPNCIEAYAYVRDGIVLSSVVYGGCPAPTVSNICGVDNSDNVYCINALWEKPNYENKIMCELLKQSLLLVGRDIIIMYCDTAQKQIIKVLKTIPFLYLGMTDSQYDRAYEPYIRHTLFGDVEVKNNKHNITAWHDKENTIVKERKRKHRFCYLRDQSLYDNLVYYEEDDYPI